METQIDLSFDNWSVGVSDEYFTLLVDRLQTAGIISSSNGRIVTTSLTYEQLFFEYLHLIMHPNFR